MQHLCLGRVGPGGPWRGVARLLLALGCAVAFPPPAGAGPDWQEIPAVRWQGTVLEVPALQRRCAAAVAYPAQDAAVVTVTTGEAVPRGLYEWRLTLRPSHVADSVAFNSAVDVRAGETVVAMFPGQFFARVHQPEVRTLTCVQAVAGPLQCSVAARTDPAIVEKARTAASLRQGGPRIGESVTALTDDGDTAEPGLELEARLTPERAVYYLLEKVEFRPLSRSGQIVQVTRNKLRYAPGETLKGAVELADAGGQGGQGTLHLYLEHGVRERVRVKSLPVTLSRTPQTIPVEVPLPQVELGYALVAEFVSADGADRSEAAEYFTIAANFNRVYIGGGGGGGHGATKASEGTMRGWFEAALAGYGNASEAFAWAEDDMVEMSPETDYWFSGQTTYHLKKSGLQQMIRLSHEYGIAQVSYAKFIMSGYLGWKTAYDYPNDHRAQYFYPTGMWEGVDVPALDRFRNKEFVIYESCPKFGENPFVPFGGMGFMPINPDATPRMARLAAEEIVRSAEMFGWDGIRWDGHPRGGGQCGGNGTYDALAARRTQALVRYLKDIVGARFPAFGHGYNYLMIQQTPGYDWAVEDFELDELCRGGGLLMNESIGNATSGPYAYIARNLQIEGDLARERGGYLLGISYAMGPRDHLVEGALWAAAGARPYNGCLREVARYLTRYAQYTLDERLRRLVTPEKVLAPVGDTRLWWQPFVYETPAVAAGRQLVVNLLNLPLQETRTPEADKEKPKYTMAPGTDPVTFALTLPPGCRATGVHLIDPWTLAVTRVPLADGRFEVPPVAIWLVAVIDLETAADAPALASLYGPPRTLGVPRPERQGDPQREVVLDPKKDVWEVNRDMAELAPESRRQAGAEQAALDALPWDERNARIVAIRQRHPAELFIQGWWKGGTLPADLALKDKAFAFGDLSPRRNGRLDIYHGRGAMDYRLRLAECLAGLDRFAVHDAPLVGTFRAGGGHSLAHAVDWRGYPQFDLLLYTAIPHCAMGAENCYAMVEYVKAGGAVLLTGGEYAFGKGGYNHTVIERELLPVLCAENVDTRYAEEPLALEPGKDFGELGVHVDFAARPAFWVWNQVALKADPGVKVFLKSGNRPVLAGWQVGKGRVACLLLDHRGKSENGVTAFFDWTDWPVLVRALLTWLTPAAGTVTPPPGPALTEAEIERLVTELEEAGLDDAVAGLEDGAGTDGLLAEVGVPREAARELTGDALRKRLATIERLLPASVPAVTAALVAQLAGVSNLPAETRFAMVDAVRARPPAGLAEEGRSCLASKESAIRGNGLHLLAMAGDVAFAEQMLGPAPTFETDPLGRQRDLALGLILYRRPDLLDEGRRRVQAWNAAETKAKAAYTGGADFSLAAPEVPLLGKDELFQRVAWLAYLSRYDAATWGAQFVREWLMTAQYESYCGITAAGIWSDKQMTPATKRAKAEDFTRLRVALHRLRELTRPDLDRLAAAQPAVAAQGLARAHFTAEVRLAIRVLGELGRGEARDLADRVRGRAGNADLGAFAAARAAAP